MITLAKTGYYLRTLPPVLLVDSELSGRQWDLIHPAEEYRFVHNWGDIYALTVKKRDLPKFLRDQGMNLLAIMTYDLAEKPPEEVVDEMEAIFSNLQHSLGVVLKDIEPDNLDSRLEVKRFKQGLAESHQWELQRLRDEIGR